MSVAEVIKYGDPHLRNVCSEVDDFKILPEIVSQMYDTMYEESGIGLAANQIGIDLNLFIIDITHTDEADGPSEFVNGKIMDSRGEATFSEGCLSIPGVEFEIMRPEFVTLQYQKLDGTKHTTEFDGLYARAIQHEIDHLNGKMIIDHVSAITRLRYKSQLKEIKEAAETRNFNSAKTNTSARL